MIKLQPCNFPVNFAKFFENSFSHEAPTVAAFEKFMNFSGKYQWQRCNRLIQLNKIVC